PVDAQFRPRARVVLVERRYGGGGGGRHHVAQEGPRDAHALLVGEAAAGLDLPVHVDVVDVEVAVDDEIRPPADLGVVEIARGAVVGRPDRVHLGAGV